MIASIALWLIARKPSLTMGYARTLAKLIVGAGAMVVLIAAGTGLYLWLDAREDRDDKANQEIGAAVQRESDLTKTIERVETAHEAREAIADPAPAGDNVRYQQCLRTARTPANCVRFLPDGAAPDR